MALKALGQALDWLTESRIAFVTAGTYAVGWLVNGQYLYWLNIVQLDQVSPRHLLTGGLTLILPTLLMAWVASWRPRGDLKRPLRIILGASVAAILMMLLYVILAVVESDIELSLADLFFVVPTALFVGIALGARGSYFGVSDSSAKALRTLQAAAALIAVLMYLVWFTGRVYPSIPMAIGGGRPIEADLVIRGDDLAAIYESDLGKAQAQGETSLFKGMLILYRTDDHLYVRKPPMMGDGRTVEVQRDSAILIFDRWRR